jgi:cation transport regulator ChaB
MPKDRTEDLPGTIERSPRKARRTYEKTLESAHEQYGDEERALDDRARRLDIDGRSTMSKVELGQAIARAQD